MIKAMRERKMAFNVGDTVKLKSGGPLMTVTNPSAHAGGKAVVSCNWFDGSDIKGGVFPAETLELAAKPQPTKITR